MKEKTENKSIDKIIKLIKDTPNNYFLTLLFVVAAITMGVLDIPYYGWFIFAAFISADIL